MEISQKGSVGHFVFFYGLSIFVSDSGGGGVSFRGV